MKKKVGIFLAIVFFVLAIDIATKRYIVGHIPLALSPFFPYGGIAVFKNSGGVSFCITHAINTGAAWGAFSDHKVALIIARVCLIGALIVYQFRTPLSTLKQLAFACVTGGAIGNVIDHFLYGHVIDMFFFTFSSYHFPVFNCADTFIFCGISTLLLEGLISKSKSAETRFPT